MEMVIAPPSSMHSLPASARRLHRRGHSFIVLYGRFMRRRETCLNGFMQCADVIVGSDDFALMGVPQNRILHRPQPDQESGAGQMLAQASEQVTQMSWVAPYLEIRNTYHDGC